MSDSIQLKTADNQVDFLVSLLAKRAIYGWPGQKLDKQLRRWMVVLDFVEDDPPGVSLCIDDTPNPKPDQVIPGIGYLTDSVLNIAVPSVSQTLAELTAYAHAVGNTPFLNDKGAGYGVLMETRYNHKHRFLPIVHDLLSITYEVYAECLRGALRPDVCVRISSTNLDDDYYDHFTRKLGLSAVQKMEFLRLMVEYSTANQERKGEIFMHFLKQGWGKPYEL